MVSHNVCVLFMVQGSFKSMHGDLIISQCFSCKIIIISFVKCSHFAIPQLQVGSGPLIRDSETISHQSWIFLGFGKLNSSVILECLVTGGFGGFLKQLLGQALFCYTCLWLYEYAAPFRSQWRSYYVNHTLTWSQQCPWWELMACRMTWTGWVPKTQQEMGGILLSLWDEAVKQAFIQDVWLWAN